MTAPTSTSVTGTTATLGGNVMSDGGVDIANSDLLRPVVLGTGANPEQIVKLAAGTVINAGSNFVAGESGSTTHVGPAANQFQLGSAGYLGFAFGTTVGGPDYYGWAQVVIDNTGAGSIVDWAYESTAGTAIMAGQIAPVPEPATLAAGLLCLGAAALRRRRGAPPVPVATNGTPRRVT